MALDIGRVAYEAYAKEMDGFAWENLSKVEQNAWRKAAVAVWKYLDQSKEDMEKGRIG